MRRPPIACQRAVQSLHSPALQHVWIADDQLSIAVNRFFRTTCPYQKRHGSHVPGPLEARRRAAKRRMTASAAFYPQDHFLPSFNLRALFAFRRSPSPAWQYQPPSLPKHVPSVDDALKPPLPSSTHCETTPLVESANPALSHDPTHESEEDPHQVAHTAVNRLDNAGIGSATDCESVHEVDLATISRLEPATSDAVDIQACFDQFKTAIAQTDSTSRKQDLISAFESSCPPLCANAWEYNVMVIEHLLERNWDPAPLLALAEDRPFLFTLPPTYTSAHRELLRHAQKISIAFPHGNRQLHALYVRLAQAAASADISIDATQDAELIAICRQLWQSSHTLGSKLCDSVRELLCAVASKLENQQTRVALHPVLAQIYSKDGSKHAIMQLISRASASLDQYVAAANVLCCMPRNLLLDIIPTYTLHLSSVKRKSRAAVSTHKAKWSTWLELICRAEKDSALGLAFLDAAIEPLAKAAFHKVSKEPSTRRYTDCVRPENLLHTLLFKFAEQDAVYATSKLTIAQSIDSSLLSISSRNEVLQPEAVVATVLSALKKACLPHGKFADAVAALLAQHGNLGTLVKFMNKLKDCRLALSETSAVDAVIQDRMNALQQQAASLTNTQVQHNALTLHNCQIISSMLRKIASVPVVERETVASTVFTAVRVQRQVQHILDRADAACALPLTLRNLSTDMMLEDRVALIHQLAHQYSLDRTRSHREAWRAIYYLYKHLKEHSLTIGHLFSRAVVRTSIIRPLSEQRFVSARRLIWVCHLVARVEGEEVAKQIERDFWQWRGDLIKHAKHIHDSVGADRREKAHVSTMKKMGML